MKPAPRRAVLTAGLALWLGLPLVAYANAGVPMIFVVSPLLGCAIVPIVVAEGAVFDRLLSIGRLRAYGSSALANAVSTLVGVPLTWGALVALELVTAGDRAYGIDTPLQKLAAVTWQGAWLIPYEEHLHWMIPAACLFLILPFFAVSVWSERLVCARLLRDRPAALVRRSVLIANALTYGALALLSLVWLGASIGGAG